MTFFARTLLLSGLALAMPLAASAQEVIVGARESGSNDYVVGAAVASTISDATGMTGKVLTASGAAVWMPMMDYGEVDLGVTSHYEAWLGWKGKGGFHSAHNIRAVVVGGGINVGLYVMNDSPVKTRYDVKGLRMASQFSGSPAVADYALGEIADAGLGWDDVQGIPRASLYASQREDVAEGRLDVYYASVGSGITSEIDSTKGIRFLGLDTSDEALARMRKVYPALITRVKAGSAPGIREDMSLAYLATYIVTRADLSDDTVYKITKAMYEENDKFRAINKSLGGWNKDKFAAEDMVIPYHDGAIRYFKEAGLWTDAMQKRQDALLAEGNS